MKLHIAISNLLHNGKHILPGESVLLDEKQASDLKDLGVVKEPEDESGVKTAEEVQNIKTGDNSVYTAELKNERDEQIALVEKLKEENETLNQGIEDLKAELLELKTDNEKLTADLKAAEELMSGGSSDIVTSEATASVPVNDQKIILDVSNLKDSSENNSVESKNDIDSESARRV